jgi:hypothetical protein
MCNVFDFDHSATQKKDGSGSKYSQTSSLIVDTTLFQPTQAIKNLAIYWTDKQFYIYKTAR